MVLAAGILGRVVAEEAKPAAVGVEVTLKGPVMSEASTLLDPPKDAEKTLLLIAVEGTPEVAATVDALMKENWPGDGSIDADHAKKLNDEWFNRLK